MPKMKTHSGAKKRFKVTKSGKIKMSHANNNHFLTRKTKAQKRNYRKGGFVDVSNAPAIKLLIPYK